MTTEKTPRRMVVRDRRAFSREGDRREDVPPASDPPPVIESEPDPKAEEPKTPEAGTAKDEPRVQALVTLLFNQAILILEQVPADAKPPASREALAGLQALIDMLEVLQEKTRGRLGPGDERLLERALYQLRMAFMERSRPPVPAS